MCIKFGNNPYRESLSQQPAEPEPNGHDSFAESVNPETFREEDDYCGADCDAREEEYEPDYGPDDRDDDDYDSGLSHDQQSWQDRSDYASEMLRKGKIDPEQAAEIRMGA